MVCFDSYKSDGQNIYIELTSEFSVFCNKKKNRGINT